MVIACRVLYLTQLGRECPHLPRDLVSDTKEWQAILLVRTQTQAPKQPPSLNAGLRMIAIMDGFLAHMGDGEPGPQKIWMGPQRARDFVLTLDVHHAAKTP